MRLHHLNAISTCPLGGRLFDDRSASIVQRGELCCHCILVEGDDGLILVDTGLGVLDVADPPSRLSRFFLALLRPDLRDEMTAVRQIERLGFDRRDVRHILLTHLDFDHAGGLDDFPEATVHLMERERDAAIARPTILDRMRYRPAQWSSLSRWKVYQSGEGEPWFGFDCVRALDGLPPELAFVPLIGHTHGHTGVAIRRDAGDWLLLAGDAYFFHREMDPEPWCTPGLRFYQWMMAKDREARLWNRDRLRELVATRLGEVEVACSHDVTELERLSGRSVRLPAGAVLAEQPPGIAQPVGEL